MAGTYDWRQSPLVRKPGPVAPNAKKTASAPRAASLSGWRTPSQQQLNQPRQQIAKKPTPKPNAAAIRKAGIRTPWQGSNSGNVGKFNPNPKPFPYGPDGKPTVLPNNGGGSQQPDPVLDLDSYLGGDVTYNDQMSLFQKILEDYMLSNTGQRGDVEEDFATALERMGLERGRAKKDMTGDFASRGLLNSGLFTGEMAEYDTDYQNTVDDLTTDKNRAIEDLLESLGMFQTQLEAQKVAARQEAIRRYAERFSTLPDGSPAPNPDSNPVAGGTPPNQKPMGPSSGRKPAPTKKTAKKTTAKKATAAKKASGPFGVRKWTPPKKTTAAQRRAQR